MEKKTPETAVVPDSRNDFDLHARRACCACLELRDDVRNVVCLPEKAPVPGTGWGCVRCGLKPDGALALVCGKCAAPADPNDVPKIVYAYVGKIGSGELTAVKWLKGHQEHNVEQHGGLAA